MHDPVFAPDARSDSREESSLFQLVAKLGAEDWGERFNGHQKVFPCGQPAALISQTTTGDDVMHVRMIEELAGPGMQHADHGQTTADEPWVLGQLQ